MEIQVEGGFWSMTIHYVNEQMLICIKALACSVISARNTDEVLPHLLVHKVTKCKVNFDKTKRIYFVTGGGANIVAAVRLSPFTHRDCFSHELQLCIESGLKDDTIQATLKNARNLVGHNTRALPQQLA